MALGCGCRSCFIAHISNSEFTSNLGYALSYHSNTDFDIPASINIDDCIIKSKLTYWGVRFGGMKSNVLNRVTINNSIFNGIRLYEETSESGIDWIVTGSGNSESPYEVTTNENLINFSDETLVLPAYGYISKGIATKYVNYSAKVTDNMLLFIGVSMNNGNAGEYITIKNKGLINVSDMYNLTCNVGDKIIIGNSGIVKVDNTATNFIGVCIADGIIRLVN